MNINNSKTRDVEINKKFKLNYMRTILIGVAYFGILLIWTIYDSYCPTFLTELFEEIFPGSKEKDVQYLVGIMMALDNIAALIMLPILGPLSDKTHTKIGKRMPYILVGTFLCALAFPFIPVFFHIHSLAGVIATMGITLFFATIYRNPVVSLMPDITPKPLRSKANGIINILGYTGGVFAMLLGVAFSFSDYLASWKHLERATNIWILEIPFIIGSLVMIIAALVLFFVIKENKIEVEMKDEMARGEVEAEVIDQIDESKPMSKDNKIMLWIILCAAFLWYMADNGINTFMVNYTVYYLQCKHSSSMINSIAGGLGLVLGFGIGGIIASKIGRKWTIFMGLGITFIGILIRLILSLTIPVPEANPSEGIYNKFPIYLYVIWFVKSFGVSMANVNAFPMTVEVCSNKKVGQFTSYYFISAMAAQTITPIALGSLLLIPSVTFEMLPLYALILITISGILVFFIKNVKINKSNFKKGIESYSDLD